MNASKVQARKMVLVSAFALAAISIYRDRSSSNAGHDTFKSLWGVGVVALLLSLLADFAPTIAGPFAVLVVLGSLTNGGDQVIQNALGKVGTTPAPASSAHSASASSSTAGDANTSPGRNRQ